MENKGDYFSLKWSDFRSSFSKGFHDFLQEESMVDVTLAVDGKFVQAHKLVLSVCSPYFENLFKANPCKHPIVILKDVGHSDLSYMLDFMYRGEVGVKHEDLPSFLKLAETLKVKGLAGEKIEQDNESHPVKNLDSNLARIRKKISKNTDAEEKYAESESSSEKSAKKLIKSRKRRLSCKPESVKKLKSEKCEISGISNCDSNDCDNLSEDEDNKPLLKLVGDNSVNLENSSKLGESHCDNENKSQCYNKTNFSHWSDGILDSKDSDGPDIHSVFRSDYSDEAEETPQGVKSKRRVKQSVIWNYYKVETDHVECKACGKTLKGIKTTNAESHLGYVHPDIFKEFCKWKMKAKKDKLNNYNACNLIFQTKRVNPVWDYFQLEGDKAMCKLCHKLLAYKNHMYLTSLCNHLSSKRYGHYNQYLEYVSKKNEMFKETDLFNSFFRKEKKTPGALNMSMFSHHLQ